MEQRLIDANALPEMEMEKFDTTDAFEVKAKGAGRNHMRKIINDAPTIDAVQVVRCGECKHWAFVEEVGGVRYGDCTKKDALISRHMMPWADYYCADGKRKEKENG